MNNSTNNDHTPAKTPEGNGNFVFVVHGTLLSLSVIPDLIRNLRYISLMLYDILLMCNIKKILKQVQDDTVSGLC